MIKPDEQESTVMQPRRWTARMLDWIEWAGNKLPDPVVLFLLALVLTAIASAVLAPIKFTEIDPRTMGVGLEPQPIRVYSQLTGNALVTFLSKMVKTFTDFPPLGVVLVALLGVGVADHTGFINAVIKSLLRFTPKSLLTPMLLLVAIVSHTAGDSGYVLVIPLGGVIFAAAGRHPLAGIATAFAGVSGGFSANFLPSGLDPLLQGFTQVGAQLIDPTRQVNPLCNWWFTAGSSVLIIAIGWYITDWIIEPRLTHTKVDDDMATLPRMDLLSTAERRGLIAGAASMLVGLALLALTAWPAESAFRDDHGELSSHDAPLMSSIVPLICLLFLVPGIVHGYVSGTVKSHRDIVQGMSKSMSTMGYYIVLAFFAAQFTYVFRESNVGALIAIKGAATLKAWHLPGQVTIVGMIVITVLVDLVIGSASAKWALMGPIFVPMFMQLGLSPELTQAAYRVGDSTANIITPLMPYFPLVVVYCQQYVKRTGIGTLVSLMLPYSLAFLVGWVLFLLVYWALGLPLGLQASYTYP